MGGGAAGDHGDPDLAAALDAAEGAGCPPPAAVVFGHMHHCLSGDGKLRRRLKFTENGTLHLNTAVVPRVRVRWAHPTLPYQPAMPVTWRVLAILCHATRNICWFLSTSSSLPTEVWR